ncbi:DUF3558 domain-containing protein [Amycolatopsis roodepoortensis]|uniref:DUF3558 domain-containing protein n=1 Tax=Amycolatopsis roodepoortensis TaxID=700274 RepID=UPI00214CCB75|nr:DUF3558 domain-containing protein [Amycolatopsis roodepoortensis]UUV32251.1 DUF3558 domain-containing protein [Amycolatopsis roodepoortensis]
MTRLARAAGPSTLLVLATVVAGCGPAPVSPPPSPTTTRTIGLTTRVPPYAGAPAVRDPLPGTVLSGHPCATALTPVQVKQILGIEASGSPDRNEPAGPTCLWENPATARTVRVVYATTHRQGLSAVYPSRSPEEGWVWREGTVGGFPSVVTTRDPQWYCTVTVGLADDAAVGVSLLGRVGDTRDVCAATGQAAELVVATLRKQVGR